MTDNDPRIERLLAEADNLLLGLFRNALIGLYVIQKQRFTYVNQQLADDFGYTPDELCGGLGPRDLTAPEDWETARTAIDRRVRGDSHAAHYGFRGVRKDGSSIDVEVYGVSTSFEGQPAIIGILMNVSQRRSAERANADQLRFIEQLIDTIPSPVFYKDEQGRYLGGNTAFERYLGIPRAQLIGRSVYDISPKDLADKYFAADQALFEQRGTQTYEATVSYADGSRHDVIFYKATFNKADGKLGGLVGVIHDISERKRMEEAIWHEANYDPLTGLPNRRLFRDRLHREIKHARRQGEQLALLFIDLDRFKEVNDTLGHDIGDLLLSEAGKRLASALRESDTVSRQGGDEFMVILPDLQDKAQAAAIADQVITKLAEPYTLRGHQTYVSASIGIALYPTDSVLLDTLLSYADQAMYAAKAQGRNGHSFFLPAMQATATDRHRLSNDLRHALADSQLAVHYQPIVELATGAVVKAEALLRWHHPQRGLVSPADFIPIAEEIGIIGEIGEWVFRQAMQVARHWRRQCGDTAAGHPLQINVNISPRQVIAGNCRHWQAHLEELGLPTSALAVEITEGLLLDERPAVVDTLLDFDRAGIQVSIDDFGTGYSAMSYLKKFDIDYIKIDRSFIRDLMTDPGDLAIAEAMIVMAHKLGIKVVAEGVETEEQRALLAEAGCDYIQGYLIARPIPEDEFYRFVLA